MMDKPVTALESRLVRLAIGTAAVALVAGGIPIPAQDQLARDSKAKGMIVFREIAAEAGVSFRFDNGSRGKHDLPEIMGGGVALFDADGDGKLDIYLCNGGPINASIGNGDSPCRLYRNRGAWQFQDITIQAGMPGASYAMGAAVGDYDGDGRADLFVTGWRDQRLYRNLGGGRFLDVTQRAGLISSLWSTSAAFADLDGDGDLDLYVATYLEYDPDSPPYCAAPDGQRDYCGPEDFPAQPDRLYRNNGDGTFSDVSRSAGIDRPEGRGLGVLIAELTGDNRPDIYVANDGTPCWLFANQGNLRFAEVAEVAGAARDGQGHAMAAMGVAIGDLDGDGRSDLVVTNFFNRSTVAFQSQAHPKGSYRDASSRLGLTAATRLVLGFGVVLADFNGDGRVDLIQANGHVLDRARLGTPFAMRPTLLRNSGSQFNDDSGTAGPWFDRPILGRGLAVGDLDQDGRPDVVVNAIDAPAALLRNTTDGGRFLILEVVDRDGGPATGAHVRVTAGGHAQAGEVVAGGSYLSASAHHVCFGLGHAVSVDRVEVAWPWGQSESWTRPSLPAHGLLRIKQGTGHPIR
jgi:enediyne biosynthesis protein E4